MLSTILSNDRTERGQVGIGTLIVFIAMVLVAAIAAGVLINTAGLLQSQAEATGEQSSDQVSNNVDIISAQGVDNANGNVDEVTLVLKKAAGSDAINVDDIEIQLLNPEKGTGVTTVDDLSASPSAISGSPGDLLEQTSDRSEVVIDLGDGDGTDADFDEDLSIEPGSSAELTLTTASGAQTFKTLSVSSPIQAPEDL